MKIKAALLLVVMLAANALSGCVTPAGQGPSFTAAPATAQGAHATPQAVRPDGVTDPPGVATPASEGLDPNEAPMEHTLGEYQKLNDEVIGWLKIPNTKIDYPVVRGKDNDYYLENSVEKKASKAGAIFMDYRNAKSDQQSNLVIYGHNMKDGSMFHDLRYYKEKKFFEKNRAITLTLGGKELKYEVFAAFIAQVETAQYNTTKFANAAAFVDYANAFAQLSKFDAGVRISPEDQILTLMTCTYEYDKSRFVVVARRAS